MATAPPGGAPGTAGNSSGYPQYGVKGTSIKAAASESAKETDEKAGYLTWFTSRAAANSFVSSQTSALNGSIPAPDPLSGIEAVGHFFSSLEDGSLWRSLAWIVLGGILLLAGILLWLHKPLETAVGTIGGAALKAP